VQLATAGTQPAGGVGGGFGGGGAGGGRGEEPVLKQGDAIQLVTAGPGGQPAVTQLQVDPNGSVTVPGMGTFQCAGLTLGQLKNRLSETAQTGTATDAKLGALIEVKKLDDAAGQPARPADMDAVAAVTEQDAVRREARFRDEALLRSRNVPAQQPGRAMRQADRAAERPAPRQPSDVVASASPAAPAPVPAPTAGEPRGGVAGNAVVTQQVRQKAEAPVAGGVEPATKDVNDFADAAPRAAAPATQADRFDVVFLVQSEGADAAAAGGGPTPSAEPTGPIEKFEILTVQLGDGEADAVNVRVGEDGTVELPKLGRVKAEGQTSEALREEIAAKLKAGASESEASKVAVRRLGTAEAGQKPQPESAQPAPQEQPAPKPTDVAPPATDKPQ